MFQGFGVYITCSSNSSSFQFAPNFLKLISSLAICIDYIDPPEFPITPLAMASSSSAVATSFSNKGYDVFINHRGPDVKTFASHLYRRLLSHGLRPFLDIEEQNERDDIVTQIEAAIATASVHVAIFSPHYAESIWCLKELVLMLESKAVILPVFYHVSPSKLQRTKGEDGSYAWALRSHENKGRHDPATIEKWRNALLHVSNISGFDLKACNGDEAELVEKVVERVLEVVSKPGPLYVAKYPLPSTSPVSTSISNYRYDVFINHAPELKKTFANHLYCRLVFYGMQPFQESEKMEKGDNLSTEIEEAIATASVHVAIFSRTYAESHLCLDELLLMLESGAPVFPVFYDVKPFELPSTKGKDGVYARALQKHQQETHTGEEKPRYSPDTIDKWREALHRFSDRNLLEIEEFKGDEAELLDSVVKIVLEKVRKAPLYVFENPIRLDEMVEELENTVLLQRQRGKPQVVGIVGSSGVGKTTLAKELINRKSSSFNRTCFLFDVRETVARSSLDSLRFLQIKLFKNLTNMNIQIESVAQGIELFTKDISSIGATAFVILDDIDEVHQLEALLPVQNVLPSKSLILITSRSKDVLTSSGVEESSIYNLTVNEQSSSLAKHQSVLDRKVKGFADAVLLQQQIGNPQIVGIDRQSSSLAKYPSVLDRKVKNFADTVLLQWQSKEPQIVGIVGLAGIGKTRLAREFFNRKSSNYRRSYFFYDVTENARTSFSLHTLQSKLLLGLTQLDLQVESEDEGIYLFKEHVSPFRSLVILDNVDHCDHLHALLSVLTVLPSSSLILITSRDKDVLKRSGVEDSSIYELEGLNTEDSLELFCTHAFGQPTPRPEFQDLADEFLRTCNGLPLTLKVFGALLWGKTNRSYWKKLLNKFRQILHHDIKEILKLSYDKLNEEEQQIFLHIACSCIGEKRDFAVRLWDGSGLFFFESLEKRCLVEVDSEDCIIMHEQLRDLGRTIADEKGLRRPL